MNLHLFMSVACIEYKVTVNRPVITELTVMKMLEDPYGIINVRSTLRATVKSLRVGYRLIVCQDPLLE